MISLNEKEYHCPIEVTIGVIGGKWKMLILWNLRGGVKRFNELRRLIPGSTQKMLTAQLRELEHDGIILRKVYPQIPPKVEYSLTRYGQSLKPFIELTCELGKAHIRHAQRDKSSLPKVTIQKSSAKIVRSGSQRPSAFIPP